MKKVLKRGLSLLLAVLTVMALLPQTTIKVKAADGVDEFVTRCYKVALDREPDPVGFNDWTSKLRNGQIVGFVIAREFIFSKEYLEKNKTDDQYVKDLYMMFVNREPEPDGYAYWMDKLANKVSREEVFAGFSNSKEFIDLCLGYGITAGYYSAGYEVTQINNVNLFVERLYKTTLDRIGDSVGQEYWTKGLLEKRLTGAQCAANFVKSDEFVNKGLSNADYLTVLYKGIMGRTPDETGWKYWLDALNNKSKTRDEVFEGFAKSDEFKGICAAYGIECGDYVATDRGSKNVEIKLYSFTDEVPQLVQYYIDTHPDCGIKLNAIIKSADAGIYQPTLDAALQDPKNAPDIYAVESTFALKYTKGDYASYALPYSKLGIDINNAVKVANIAQYSIDIGTNPNGEIVGLGYEGSGGAFIYRRSIAKATWGTDDPAVIKQKIGGGTGNWDMFWKAAEELKAKGYKIVSGDGDIWHAVENSADTGWVVDGKLYIDPKREAFMDMSKKLVDNGYSDGAMDWTQAWFDGMISTGTVLGYFGPAWFINYSMKANCYKGQNSSYGDWAVCEAPTGFFWGGTWLIASKYVPERGNAEAVKKIIEYVTLDTSAEGLQSRWANGSIYYEKDAVTSGTVMRAADGTNDFLGGQNMYNVYVNANNMAKGTNVTQYDSFIAGYWREAALMYSRGEMTHNEAMDFFKMMVEENTDIVVE